MTTTGLLEDIAAFHPNAIVAWDRDVPGDWVPEAAVAALCWGQCRTWAPRRRGTLVVESRATVVARQDGIGAVTYKLWLEESGTWFRPFVLVADESDPLGCRWIDER